MDATIQTHLLDVVKALRAIPSTREVRRQLLDELEAYARAGAYPTWDDVPHPTPRSTRAPRTFRGRGLRAPRWRDAAGRWCAVGHLMAMSDRRLARSVNRSFGNAFVAEMDDPRIAGWAQAHGFTLAELAWVQPHYFCGPVVECGDLDELPALEEPAEQVDCEVDVGFPIARTSPTVTSSVAFCQDCDGQFHMWMDVQNRGSRGAEDVWVELRQNPWDGNAVYDRVEGLRIAPGGVVRVELTTDSVLEVGVGGEVHVGAAPRDCDDDNNVHRMGTGARDWGGWVMPYQCSDYRCPGDLYCGCASTSATHGVTWGLGLGLGLLLLRRRREPSGGASATGEQPLEVDCARCSPSR